MGCVRLVGTTDERALHAAVLIAKGDLQVEDVLAVALEAEVSRLDDAGVDGTDGDLVDLVPLDAVEVHHADDGARLCLRSWPASSALTVAWKRTGLSQGWPSGADPPLLGDFPLEEVDLRAVGRHRGKGRRSRASVEPTCHEPSRVVASTT